MFTLIATLALAADIAKHPCVIHLVEPAGCAGDVYCVEVENTLDHLAVAPTIEGVCGVGKMAPVDLSGEMQGILDPQHSTEESPVILPVLAPQGSAYPSRGWLTFPKVGPMVDGVREALNDFTVSAKVYGGTFSDQFTFFVRPGRSVQVFDDDRNLDIDEHGYVGTCLKQKIEVGIHKKVQYGGSCSGPELAKSRR